MIWEIDPAHSQVSFALRVLSLTTTRERFKRLHSQLSLDEQNPTNSWVEAEADAAGLDTHHPWRDAHLRSKSFFSVKHYPTIAFQSTQVEQTDGPAYQVSGNLTLLGITQPITFDVDYGGQSTEGDTRVRLTARATINRKDFGPGQGMLGHFAASDRATIELVIVAVQPARKVPEPVASAE